MVVVIEGSDEDDLANALIATGSSTADDDTDSGDDNDNANTCT